MGGNGCHIDDSAAAACFHAGKNGFADEYGALKIDVHHFAVQLLRHLGICQPLHEMAGIVDQNVNGTPECVLDLGHQSTDSRNIRHVGLKCTRLPA
ncbi:hypothetical protein PAT3040_00590 [Paenibacillus agaridevorans]|uniref:Uncharacterized protein n=1 Tax=Paenibacillus agaridevorans TaxID=171404 RepID=A0A2R5EKD5_9BACL|nr:hypothetical protein PAT3040_00590 [Paenibacillus agaridevorans]